MSESEINIRPACKQDMVPVAALIQELAEYEKMPNGPKISIEVLQHDGFESNPPAFRCLVAEYPSRKRDAIVGYAVYFPTYSTWEGRAMMLQNFYVTASERRRGIGEKLFNTVAKEAIRSGCSRLDFHVREWNKARSFYERKGAVNLTGTEHWCYYRITGEALTNAADKGNN